MAKIVNLLLLTLVIDRDATTKLPVQAFDYELPILEELYPPETISEVKRESVEVKNFDEHEVFAGLENKYGRTPEGAEALKYAYRNKQDFTKAVAGSIAAAKDEAVEADDDQDEDEDEQATELQTLAGKTVDEIREGLDTLTDEELHELAEIEMAGKNRKGVIDAINAALGDQGSDTE